MSTVPSIRMPRSLRWAIFVTFGGVWLSGCSWLILHEFFAHPAEFGPVGHPWEPGMLRLHGWFAIGSVFLLGWVTARHVSDKWTQMTRRYSGFGIAGLAVILAVTGYALYYTSDGLHDTAAVAHEVLGTLGILFALTHWRRFRRVTLGARVLHN